MYTLRRTILTTAMLSLATLIALFALPLARATATTGEPFMGGTTKTTQFSSPQSCTCHDTLLSQWSQTMHANALSDPFFTLQKKQVKEAAGQDVVDFCDTCHAPAAMTSGGIKTAQSNDALNGITCTVCHQVTEQNAKHPGNASLSFAKGGPDGVLHAQIMDPQAPHQATGNKLFDTSEYCGACHNVTHPLNGLKLETTYDEWAKSSYAKDGVTCQNCHMASSTSFVAPESGTAGMGAPTRDNIYSMTFVGANVAQGNAELATALLKKAAKVEIATASDIVAAGQKADVTVKVTNVGAGHSIPTSLTEVRNMRLVISAQDAQGKKTEVGSTQFGTVLTDDAGKEVGAQFWLGSKKKSDLRIAPGETYTQDVEITMPTDADSQTLVAELTYQSAHDEDIEPSGVDNPTTVMASAQQALYTTEAAKAAAAKTEKQPTQESSNADGDDNKGFVPAIIVSAVILVIAVAVLVIIKKRKQ